MAPSQILLLFRLWEFPEVPFPKEESFRRGSAFKANSVGASFPSPWSSAISISPTGFHCSKWMQALWMQVFLSFSALAELWRGRSESATDSSVVCHLGSAFPFSLSCGPGVVWGKSWREIALTGMKAVLGKRLGLHLNLEEVPRFLKFPEGLHLPCLSGMAWR